MILLHLTDLHFSNLKNMDEIQQKWSTLFSELDKTLRKYEWKIDIVAVTGDFTSHGSMEEFEMAQNYLNQLKERLELDSSQFIFCEGNHDADVPTAGSTFIHYQQFEKSFFEGKLDNLQKTEETLFCQINTNTRTSTEYFDDAFIPANCEIEKKEGKCQILLMHHQPEVIKNQEELRKLCDSVDIILCGHLHSNTTRMYYYGNTVIVNGMAVTPHLPEIPAGFQIIKLDKAKINRIVTVRINFMNGAILDVD